MTGRRLSEFLGCSPSDFKTAYLPLGDAAEVDLK